MIAKLQSDLKSAANDGRFVIFAIRDDCKDKSGQGWPLCDLRNQGRLL